MKRIREDINHVESFLKKDGDAGSDLCRVADQLV